MTFAPFALPLGFSSQLRAAPTQPDLSTRAELSLWMETGRYEEVERLCPAFAKAYPSKVRCFQFGTTPEGRPMLAMAVGEAKYLTASPTKSEQRPVVLFQGGIHAGEIDGKDAGFWLIRDILNGKTLPNVLRKVTLVFVPVFNVDGHERFGANNRPNQIGPKEMGWRVTAQNFNLNRDYLKTDAPETRAMIKLLKEWDPILYVDLHVTDGAKFQHDIALMIEPSLSGPKTLRDETAGLRAGALKDLQKAGNLPLSTYPSFIKDDEPQSGIAASPASVRFSNGYWALSNRIAVLVETHSWRPYAHRVKSTYEAMKSLIYHAAESGVAWRKAAHIAEEESKRLPGTIFPLAYKNTTKSETIDFLGYAYTRTKSNVSGQLMTRYDASKPEVWHIPFFPDVEPKLSAAVPRSYMIPAAYRGLYEERLKLHGILFEVLPKNWEGKGKAFHIKVTGQPKIPVNESHQRFGYDGTWESIDAKVLAGSLKVDMNQSQAKLAMFLLDPASPDSLLAWGYMNQIFERKEYMEPYVAEEVAEAMLKDPQIKAEFDERLKDPEFAKDPDKRLDFFAAKHPSFDQLYMVYPVLKMD
ncbi:MAG: M14 family metallopeptidase [Chitinophagaceae bacterium]|nr:M14 family metallopeptidase [Oligoflexus sp.]